MNFQMALLIKDTFFSCCSLGLDSWYIYTRRDVTNITKHLSWSGGKYWSVIRFDAGGESGKKARECWTTNFVDSASLDDRTRGVRLIIISAAANQNSGGGYFCRYVSDTVSFIHYKYIIIIITRVLFFNPDIRKRNEVAFFFFIAERYS